MTPHTPQEWAILCAMSMVVVALIATLVVGLYFEWGYRRIAGTRGK